MHWQSVSSSKQLAGVYGGGGGVKCIFNAAAKTTTGEQELKKKKRITMESMKEVNHKYNSWLFATCAN